MLLIHTPRLTNRLGYTLNVVFNHILHTDYSLTTDEKYFLSYGGEKLCYGSRRIGNSLFLKSCNLLFQTSIDEQAVHPFQVDNLWMLFPVYGRDIALPFDPFAATFYMVSRYEEYLPHREDKHGRFLECDHIAVAHGFATQPVVDQWAMQIKALLQERYPNSTFGTRRYRYVQTVDIDSAWCYLHKGLLRTLTGLARDLFVRRNLADVKHRFRVLAHREDDPFDTFDYLISQHRHSANSHLIFFVLLADYGQYDKPIRYLNPHARQLLQHLGDYAKVGIHPSYTSNDNPRHVDEETLRLQEILHRNIVRSRFHFLRLRLPRSYRILQHASLRHDYTMGFCSTVGFRAGISSPYPFYDLERDHETELTIHPFCAMDTAMKVYMGLSTSEALDTYKQLISNIRKVDGTFCSIVHNQNLSDYDGWHGWREVYEQMVATARP